MASTLSQKVRLGTGGVSGKGLFATQHILLNEVIADYTLGKGEYVDSKKADTLFNKGQDHMIQVEDDIFFAAVAEDDFEDADYINHSCTPNCGIKNKLQVVAMRDIDIGEEITIDYAMMESSEYKFKCNCGSVECRGFVTGDDWKIKALQNRYKGYFSDYLQKKIDNL
jgi:hypothetical protein